MGNKTAVDRLEECESGSKMAAAGRSPRGDGLATWLEYWNRPLESNQRPAIYELLAKTPHRQKSRVNRVDDVDRNGPYKVSCPQPRNPGATDFSPNYPPGIPEKTAPHITLGCALNAKPDFQPFQFMA